MRARVFGLTRRAALSLVFAAVPAAALAAKRRAERVEVDVSPLRRSGDDTDADFLARALPAYLEQSVGPGHSVHVRIDSVSYGAPGSNGQQSNNGAVDVIEGVGWIDGREAPLTATVQAQVSLPDVGGYGARTRQDQLARSFAQWLPGQIGLWR